LTYRASNDAQRNECSCTGNIIAQSAVPFSATGRKRKLFEGTDLIRGSSGDFRSTNDTTGNDRSARQMTTHGYQSPSSCNTRNDQDLELNMTVDSSNGFFGSQPRITVFMSNMRFYFDISVRLRSMAKNEGGHSIEYIRQSFDEGGYDRN
jgi:hypothetical protein